MDQCAGPRREKLSLGVDCKPRASTIVGDLVSDLVGLSQSSDHDGGGLCSYARLPFSCGLAYDYGILGIVAE